MKGEYTVVAGDHGNELRSCEHVIGVFEADVGPSRLITSLLANLGNVRPSRLDSTCLQASTRASPSSMPSCVFLVPAIYATDSNYLLHDSRTASARYWSGLARDGSVVFLEHPPDDYCHSPSVSKAIGLHMPTAITDARSACPWVRLRLHMHLGLFTVRR